MVFIREMALSTLFEVIFSKSRQSCSSVARGRGGYSPPIGLSTKMQNKKNTTFLDLLKLFFALELFKASFETYIQGGANCQKLESQINAKFLKCPKINNQC